MRFFSALLLCTGFALPAACDGNGTDFVHPLTYRITAGACGDVVFVESVGVDSASAFDAIAVRIAEMHGPGDVTVEAYALEVVDEHGIVPDPRFYALRVLDAETGHHVQSDSEVITTSGDLFRIHWCPD